MTSDGRIQFTGVVPLVLTNIAKQLQATGRHGGHHCVDVQEGDVCLVDGHAFLGALPRADEAIAHVPQAVHVDLSFGAVGSLLAHVLALSTSARKSAISFLGDVLTGLVLTLAGVFEANLGGTRPGKEASPYPQNGTSAAITYAQWADSAGTGNRRRKASAASRSVWRSGRSLHQECSGPWTGEYVGVAMARERQTPPTYPQHTPDLPGPIWIAFDVKKP